MFIHLTFVSHLMACGVVVPGGSKRCAGVWSCTGHLHMILHVILGGAIPDMTRTPLGC